MSGDNIIFNQEKRTPFLIFNALIVVAAAAAAAVVVTISIHFWDLFFEVLTDFD